MERRGSCRKSSAWGRPRHAPALLVLALLVGCKTWEPTTLSPERLIAEERPTSVRVTAGDGFVLTLRRPRIVNDSIVSTPAEPGPGAALAPRTVGVPADAVRSLEVARFSPRRTVALAAAIAAGSVMWARLAADSQGGATPPSDPLPKGLSAWVWSGLRLVAGAVGR